MIKPDPRIQNQYERIFAHRICDVGEEDYARFEQTRKMLLKIAEVENSSIVVIDIARRNYFLLTNKFNFWPSFGLDSDINIAPDMLFPYMHPDDLPFIVDTAVKCFDFIDTLPPSEKTQYKLINDFRLVNKAGQFVRFIQQTVVLELDRQGEVWLVLKLVDLMPDKPGDEPPQRKLVHMKTGQLHLFTDEQDHPSKQLLTKREKEILGLIYQGYDSNEISGRLFISLNTVNNHRQNILSKTKTKNTAQALLFAKKLGII